ncbi:MAG: hypothetical protein OXF88_04225 [Rhodobacteraceae bacterium]|nr:hypothetical protein [Paracoccaceae bacterium]MCY4136728.1 hypothetical protein [Paracoccaceae bacterium]
MVATFCDIVKLGECLERVRFILALAFVMFAFETAVAQSDNKDRLDFLFERLSDPDLENWEEVEMEVWRLWSNSGSRSMDLLLELGTRAMANGDLRTAVERFTVLVENAPGFPEGWNKRATAYFLMQRYSLSLADIEKTLTLEPRHFGAMSGLGMILERFDRNEEALGVYEHLVTIHPHRQDAHDAIRRLRTRVLGTEI